VGGVDPRRPQNDVPVVAAADRAFALVLAAAVDRKRGDGVGFDVRPLLRSVEDVVRREVDERESAGGAGVGERGGSVAVHGERAVGFGFGEVDRGVGAAVHDDVGVGRADDRREARGVGEVRVGAPEGVARDAEAGRLFRDFDADLAAGSEDEDLHLAAAPPPGALKPSRRPRYSAYSGVHQSRRARYHCTVFRRPVSNVSRASTRVRGARPAAFIA
jgi:hypothetical protein